MMNAAVNKQYDLEDNVNAGGGGSICLTGTKEDV